MSYSLSDMMIEVFENLGESTDLDLYGVATGGTYGTVNLALSGSQKIQKWINRAYRKVCSTQLSNGTFVRFRSLERRVFFTPCVVQATVVATPATNQVQLSGLIQNHGYTNWIIDIGAPNTTSQGTEQHVVIAADGSANPILTLADALSAAPTNGTLVNVYKKWSACSLNAVNSPSLYHPNEFIPVDPKEDFESALWIYDVQMQQDIRRYDERTPLYKQVLTQLYPAMFWDLDTPAGLWGAAGIGGGVEFDVAPVTSLTFEMHYYALAEALTTTAQVPLVPEPFSEMIVKWATKTGMLRDREWDAAYALRKEFEADMQTAIQDGALRFEYDFPSLWVEEN
jgi:hypothetical protein